MWFLCCCCCCFYHCCCVKLTPPLSSSLSSPLLCRYKWEQDQIQHMKDYVAKFGHGTAKNAKQAQSKEKTLEKMVSSTAQHSVAQRSTAQSFNPSLIVMIMSFIVSCVCWWSFLYSSSHHITHLLHSSHHSFITSLIITSHHITSSSSLILHSSFILPCSSRCGLVSRRRWRARRGWTSPSRTPASSRPPCCSATTSPSATPAARSSTQVGGGHWDGAWCMGGGCTRAHISCIITV
jgi:hypothetical protein